MSPNTCPSCPRSAHVGEDTLKGVLFAESPWRICGSVPYRDDRLLEYARGNRKNPTWDELRLWLLLRRRNLGYKFRRQEPIGPFIVDFVCPKQRVIVEADGKTHFQQGGPKADAARDAYLIAMGYQILHFRSDFIAKDLHGVCAIIKRHLDDPTPGSGYRR